MKTAMNRWTKLLTVILVILAVFALASFAGAEYGEPGGYNEWGEPDMNGGYNADGCYVGNDADGEPLMDGQNGECEPEGAYPSENGVNRQDGLKSAGFESTSYSNPDYVWQKGEPKKTEGSIVRIGVDHTLVEGKTKGSVVHETAKLGDDNAYIKTDVDLIRGEVKGRVGARAYTDEKGNVYQTVEASGSAEYSTVTTETTGHVGNEDVSIEGKGKAEIATAKAKAKAEAGLKNGSLKAGINGSLEANAAEVEASGKANIGGVEVGGGVKGKVGIGVSGQAKYEDGKVTIGVGATLGIGVEIKVEVNLKPVIDKAKEVGRKTADFVTNTAVPAIEKAAEKVADTAVKVKDTVCSGFRAAGRFLKGLFG